MGRPSKEQVDLDELERTHAATATPSLEQLCWYDVKPEQDSFFTECLDAVPRLISEVRALREELAQLRDDVFEERHLGGMTISIPRVPDGDAGRAFLGSIELLVKAARAVADAEASSPDKPVTLLADLQIALKPFDK